jgi:hypothetical protein
MPFVRLLPLRYDREHDPSKGRFLAAPAGRAGARSTPWRRIAAGPNDFRHPRERRLVAVAPVLVPRHPLRSADESERASRAGDESPVLANGLSRRHGPRAPSRGSSQDEESPHSTQSRASLGHRCARGSLESAPARRTSRRHARRFAPREGNERCERIEMLSIVHHSFARMRIAPRHARVEPGRPAPLLKEDGVTDRALDAFGTARSVQWALAFAGGSPACAGVSPLAREG